jgi:hypothetical protein
MRRFWLVLIALVLITGAADAQWSFTTGDYPPATPPIQISPIDGEKVEWVSGLLVFEPGDFNEVWHLQVAADSSFTGMVDERMFGFIADTLWNYEGWDEGAIELFDSPPDTVGVIEYPIFNLQYNTTYWWRVRSWNESGWGDWSGE